MGQGNDIYQLIEIGKPEDFDTLSQLLDEAYDPATVAAILKGKINQRCRAVLVEHPYTDKDYRSTYYNFYAKKGYRYDSSCARLHFFEDPIEIGPGLLLRSKGRSLSENYFGYMVLRPTRLATIGRSVLSPALVDGFHGNVIDATHRVHLLGHRLTVKGFPYMSQHTDISVCAHVACWSILRHYSERYSQYAEFLTYDVTRMTGHDCATASPYEDDPLFLMYDLTRAYVFDRGGDHSRSMIKLNSPQGTVLSRMTGNLEQHQPFHAPQELRVNQPQISGDAR